MLSNCTLAFSFALLMFSVVMHRLLIALYAFVYNALRSLSVHVPVSENGFVLASSMKSLSSE